MYFCAELYHLYVVHVGHFTIEWEIKRCLFHMFWKRMIHSNFFRCSYRCLRFGLVTFASAAPPHHWSLFAADSLLLLLESVATPSLKLLLFRYPLPVPLLPASFTCLHFTGLQSPPPLVGADRHPPFFPEPWQSAEAPS